MKKDNTNSYKYVYITIIVVIILYMVYPNKNKSVLEQDSTVLPVADTMAVASDNVEKTPVLTESEKSYNRKKLETNLRNAYLDDGLDIQVKVSGKNNTIITLTYPLFNDVWTRRFEKEGVINSFKDGGFKKVFITDDYDYNVSFTLNK